MLKTSKTIESTIQPGKGGVKVDNDNKTGRNCGYKFNESKISGIKHDDGDNEVGKKSL